MTFSSAYTAITRALSESITRRLLAKQTEVFTSGADVKPPAIQVMLEEAHNLFASDRYKDDADVWVKLAKEASKLNLGMTYATQEVSGVAHQVKANTANWAVAHLNNTKELRELGQFYDFSSFSDAIISAEDRGYVRLKTLSSPYIVPVQIDRYDIELVNEARAAAGDPPLTRLPTAESSDALRDDRRLARTRITAGALDGRRPCNRRPAHLPRPGRSPAGRGCHQEEGPAPRRLRLR